MEYEAEYERALVEVKEELREKEVNKRTIGNFTLKIIVRQQPISHLISLFWWKNASVTN